MKHLFAILLALLSAFSSAAQAYHPLIRTGVSWDVVTTDGSICQLDHGYREFFSGATVTQGGQQYHELHGYAYVPNQAGPFCPPFHLDLASSQQLALLREDTVNRRVYAFIGGNDVLLYDFTLGAGDTLRSRPLRTVDHVQTASLFTGQPRRISYLQGWGGSPPDHDYLLEGIGSNYGPFTPFVGPGIGFEYVLDAVWENGVLIWGAHQTPLATAASLPEARPAVAFDPAARALRCQLPPATPPATLSVLDATSRVVLRRLVEAGAAPVSLTTLPAGLYFYDLTAGRQRVAGPCWLGN